jgi:hypothetical protein
LSPVSNALRMPLPAHAREGVSARAACHTAQNRKAQRQRRTLVAQLDNSALRRLAQVRMLLRFLAQVAARRGARVSKRARATKRDSPRQRSWPWSPLATRGRLPGAPQTRRAAAGSAYLGVATAAAKAPGLACPLAANSAPAAPWPVPLRPRCRGAAPLTVGPPRGH